MKNIIRIRDDEKEKLIAISQQIIEKPGGNYSIARLSKASGINHYKLTYGFKKITGYSLHQFIIKTRMENSKQLLLNTDVAIKEIAKLNGYNDPHNFSIAFKKYSGTSPALLRKK